MLAFLNIFSPEFTPRKAMHVFLVGNANPDVATARTGNPPPSIDRRDIVHPASSIFKSSDIIRTAG